MSAGEKSNWRQEIEIWMQRDSSLILLPSSGPQPLEVTRIVPLLLSMTS
jgi:hypothetical protein